jgi:hypothetical protein
MSNIFIRAFNEKKTLIIVSMASDAILGSIAMILYYYRCTEEEKSMINSSSISSGLSDIELWNLQWGFYFYLKVFYHLCIYFQFFSEALKLDACDELGEYRPALENIEHQLDYDS